VSNDGYSTLKVAGEEYIYRNVKGNWVRKEMGRSEGRMRQSRGDGDGGFDQTGGGENTDYAQRK
jgi:hypothetical protein